MIRRAASTAVAAVTIAASTIAAVPAAPAAAHTDDLWQTTVKCATGAFTGKKVVVDGNGRPVTWLDGWIQPCDGPGPSDQFGVIYYTGEPVDGQMVGHVLMQRLRDYDNISVGGKPTTQFSGTVDEGMRTYGPLLALCVAYDDGGLVGCVNPGKDDSATAPPSPELLSRAPVIQIPDGAETNPNCGTCL